MYRRRRTIDVHSAAARLAAQVLLGLALLVGALSVLDYSSGETLRSSAARAEPQHGPAAAHHPA